MVLILVDSSIHDAHEWRKINLFGVKKYPIGDGYRTNQMPYTGQITEIATDVCASISELPSKTSTI